MIPMYREEIGIGNPEGYGIQNPEAPGEPDYQAHEPSRPIPGTGKHTRDRRRKHPGSRTMKRVEDVEARREGLAPKVDEL
jgi:hypothetical protein